VIKELSDVRRLPRLGKIHLGVKAKNEKGVEYPKAVDYFVVPEEVKKVYGEKPEKLKIIIPSEMPDVFFPQWYKKYTYGKGLICKGDGITANRVSPTDNSAMQEIACSRGTCEDFLKGECKPVANLLFILPDVPGFGVYQIDTSSYNNIINLNSEIALLKNILGRVSGIPLLLTRETQEVVRKGKRQTVSLIHIRSPYSLNDLMKNARELSAQQDAVIEVPDNDIPEAVSEEIEPEVDESESQAKIVGSESAKATQKVIINNGLDILYGVSEEEAKERRLKLYEMLKEKKIDTIAKVKELLGQVLPDEDWSNIKRDVFEKMPLEKLSKVMEYLAE